MNKKKLKKNYKNEWFELKFKSNKKTIDKIEGDWDEFSKISKKIMKKLGL